MKLQGSPKGKKKQQEVIELNLDDYNIDTLEKIDFSDIEKLDPVL